MDGTGTYKSFAPNACHSVSPMCHNALSWPRIVLILLVILLCHPIQAGSQQRQHDSGSAGLTATQRLQHDPRSVRVADLIADFDELDYRESVSEWHESMPIDTLFLKHLVLLQLQQALQQQEQIRTIKAPPLPGQIKPRIQKITDERHPHLAALDPAGTRWEITSEIRDGELELTMGGLVFQQSGPDHYALLVFDRNPARKEMSGLLRQEGYGHRMIASIPAEEIMVHMTQHGLWNHLIAELHGRNLDVQILQEGEQHDFRFFIDAERSTLNAEQEGERNTIAIDLSGDDSAIYLVQSGEFLDLDVVIAADESEVNAAQSGMMNEAVIEQAGSGHSARVHQDGRNNRVRIRQTGN